MEKVTVDIVSKIETKTKIEFAIGTCFRGKYYDSNFVSKIVSSENMIVVYHDNKFYSVIYTVIASHYVSTEEITHEEFEFIFNDVQSRLLKSIATTVTIKEHGDNKQYVMTEERARNILVATKLIKSYINVVGNAELIRDIIQSIISEPNETD